MTSIGLRGQPQYTGGDAVRLSQYLSQLGTYAGTVGNRIVATESDRNAFNTIYGYAPYEGLELYETDTDNLLRFQNGSWRYLEYTGSIATAGTVTTNPADGYTTYVRLSHGIVSIVLNVGPGANGLSASNTNNLIGSLAAGLRPASALVKRGEWRPAEAWTGTDWAKIRFTVDGAITVVYTTAAIPSAAHLTCETSFPAA